MMFCATCKADKVLKLEKKQNEWSTGVMYHKEFKKTRLVEHNTAAKHKDSLRRTADVSRALKYFSSKPNLKDGEIMKKYRNLFRNLYFIAKNDLAYNLIEKLHTHVALLDVPLPINHLSRAAGCEILDVIAEYFRDQEITQLKACRYFSVMLDETTDNTTTKNLIIYVRYAIEGCMQTRFLTILPLKNFTSLGIYGVVANFFKPYDLFHKIVFICTDGAPVLRSTDEGLAGLIIKDNPYATSYHCIAHRFNLGVSSSVNTSKQLTRLMNFVSNCYSYLYASSKRVLVLFQNQKTIEELH
jgi:hypothetical protein